MSTNLKTRRVVLATALGAAGAATAAALAAPAAVLGENGQPVLLGIESTATAHTKVKNTTAGMQEAGLIGAAAGVGVLGESVDGQGVIGRSTNGTGVQGYSTNGAGINGFGGPYGVWADGTAIGVQGRAVSETGTGIGSRPGQASAAIFTATDGRGYRPAGDRQGEV